MLEHRFQLIVGMGNPGEEYRLTRHNVGFMVVDRLARRHGILLDKRHCESIFGLGMVKGRPVVLAKPMTFMNLSGTAVKDLASFLKLDTKEILVIHDDMDLIFGKIRIKQKGGDGGHNGVKSLIEAFGSGAFVRVRVGIGRPQTRQEAKAYVLGGFDTNQERLLDDVIDMAQDAVDTVLFKGLSEAMNRFHGKTIPERNIGRRL